MRGLPNISFAPASKGGGKGRKGKEEGRKGRGPTIYGRREGRMEGRRGEGREWSGKGTGGWDWEKRGEEKRGGGKGSTI